MMDLRSRWKSVAHRDKWAARGTSFVAKAKATKAVWFPPKPEETTKKTTGAAKKSAKKSAKKTTGAAKKSAKKATGAAKKTTGG